MRGHFGYWYILFFRRGCSNWAPNSSNCIQMEVGPCYRNEAVILKRILKNKHPDLKGTRARLTRKYT